MHCSVSRVALHKRLPLKEPFSLHVYPSFYCNFRCGYCLHSLDAAALERKGFRRQYMEFDLYRKAVDNVAAQGWHLKAMIFAGHGEPLLHPRIAEMIAYAKERGKLITYDPNLRRPLWRSMEEAREQLLWGLAQADVVKISDEEVEFLFGLSPEEGACRIVSEYGVKLVFVTCGADGCVFRNRNAGGHVPGLSGLPVLDTTGAGDIFGGSAVWGLLQTGKAPEALTREELERITAFACASAGLSTTRAGGISSLFDREEIEKRIKKA